MTFTEVKKRGEWPDYFIRNLVYVPSINLVSSNSYLEWKCPKHGIYKQLIKVHLKGHGCPKCAIESMSEHRMKHRSFPEWFVKSIENSPDRDKILQGSIKVSDTATFVCNIHGPYKRKVSEQISRHSRCPQCSRLEQARKLQLRRRGIKPFPQWFIDDLEGSPDKDKVLSGEFKSRDKVYFSCKRHGLYRQGLSDHLNLGHGCPNCRQLKLAKGSKLEHSLKESLEHLGIKVEFHVRDKVKSPLSNRFSR